MIDKSNALFLSYKKQFIKILGIKAITNHQINDICVKLFRTWNGCNSQDTIIFKNGYQIINTSRESERGVHWVALYITGKTVYVYDSFGRPTKKLLKILTAQANQKKINIIDSEHDAEQFGRTQICGLLCISWLLVVQKLGVRQALKI